MESEPEVVWTNQDFTVELWAEFVSEQARGNLVNHLTDDHTVGWSFHVPGEGYLAFSFWPDGAPQQAAVTGPNIADIGLGWHHLAATKAGTLLMLFIDGMPVAEKTVPAGVPSLTLPLQIGDQPNPLGGDWELRHVIVDDVRISETAMYTGAFEPAPSLELSENTLVLLRFDEGAGTVATDDAAGLSFSIDGATWVAGNDS